MQNSYERARELLGHSLSDQKFIDFVSELDEEPQESSGEGRVVLLFPKARFIIIAAMNSVIGVIIGQFPELESHTLKGEVLPFGVLTTDSRQTVQAKLGSRLKRSESVAHAVHDHYDLGEIQITFSFSQTTGRVSSLLIER